MTIESINLAAFRFEPCEEIKILQMRPLSKIAGLGRWPVRKRWPFTVFTPSHLRR
jgi:hypothetical protein